MPPPLLSIVGLRENTMETTIVYWGYIGLMENEMETTIVYWGYIGLMENNMETTIVYWGYIGLMEKKMESTIVYWGYIRIMEKKMQTTIVYWGHIGFIRLSPAQCSFSRISQICVLMLPHVQLLVQVSCLNDADQCLRWLRHCLGAFSRSQMFFRILAEHTSKPALRAVPFYDALPNLIQLAMLRERATPQALQHTTS